MVAAPAQVIGKRYVIHDQIGEGGMGTVYRAVDRLTRNTIALKRLTTATDALDFHSRGSDLYLSLAREFQTLASLRHPNIISVLDYGFDSERQPFFAMTLLENAQPIVEAAKNLSQQEKIDLVIQLLQALAYIHRREVVHRDLKPANVLVANGRVKVLDFGLALLHQEEDPDEAGTVVGTLTYMAPEQFEGQSASTAADLYAVGLMAYELIAGKYPYDQSNLNFLVSDIMNKYIDVSAIGLNDAQTAILERLLAKSPEDRYSDANLVIRELCEASDRPLPPETIEIRESFLQAASFVGRKAELARFIEALDATITKRGNAWIVGGESGVGKSRLMDELRIRALVQGALVLRGQAVSEGGSIYQVWRSVLRVLVLYTDLTNEEASVIKSLVPDIKEMLGRDVADAPTLGDPQQAQVRLFKVIESIFHRQTQPLLVILEDLHWEGSESLALFEYLTPHIKSLPVMLIGNYRDDERPSLPQELPAPQVVKLERLTTPDIAELSVSLLGDSGHHVVELLQRESEGNAFFAIEVVRALAERVERLEEIAEMDLPTRVFAGGMEAIVRSRLGRVQPSAYPLLQLAAIIGRQLDLDVLRALDPQVDLDEWLLICANAAVLRVQGETWLFAHDKLREQVLDDLPDDERPNLHRKVAEKIEAIHGESTDHLATLAYLWRIAGNNSKELRYAELAGREAVKNNAHAAAHSYLSRALELVATLPAGIERSRQELDIRISLGNVLVTLKGYAAPEVQETYTRAVELCQEVGETPQRFPGIWGLWLFHNLRADYRTARDLGEQLLAIGHAAQNTDFIIQAHHALWPTRLWLGEVVAVRDHVDQGIARYNREEHRSHAYMYGGHDPCVCGLAFAGMTLWLLGYPDQALTRSHECETLANELAHPHSLVQGLALDMFHYQFQREDQKLRLLTETVIGLSSEHRFPQWLAWATILNGWVQRQDQGVAQIQRGLEMYKATGARWGLSYFLTLLADAYTTTGQNDLALATLNEAMSIVEQTDERLWEGEIRRLRGEIALIQDADETLAETEFHKAIQIAQHQQTRSLELRATMSLVRLWQKQGKYDQARQQLKEIYNWFTEGFETPDLQEAKALLGTLT